MENFVNISLMVLEGKQYLHFDFQGHLSDGIASEAIEKWKRQMPAETKTSLIYNCQQMKGFDTSARRNWQHMMLQYKNQLDEVWVVCDNLFILTAAKTMGLLTGLPVKVCRTLEMVGK